MSREVPDVIPNLRVRSELGMFLFDSRQADMVIWGLQQWPSANQAEEAEKQMTIEYAKAVRSSMPPRG
jgi:hypothetical protein